MDPWQELRQLHLDEEGGQIPAMFNALNNEFSFAQDKFQVNIYCNLGAFQHRGVSLLPEPGASIDIFFFEHENDDAAADQQKKKYSYTGFITEDRLQSPNVSFCAVVQGVPFRKFGKQKVLVHVLLEGCDVATMRQSCMFQSASKGLTSDEGINWDWFLLDAYALPYHVEKNVWTALMTEYPGQKEDFEQQAKALFKLDLKQMEFTRQFLENDTGVSILFGPAGSGKTFTVVATLLLYLSTNKKYREGLKELGNRHRALVTATTEVALNELLRKCVEHSQPLGRQKFVRFNGGNRHTHQSAARKAALMIDYDTDEKRNKQRKAIEEVYWLMMDVDARRGEPKSNSDLKDFDFIYDFHKTITGWTNEHPYYKQVVVYGEVIASLLKNGSSDEERSALFETKKELEALLYKAYFNEVDAVFVPLASAAHPILSSFFEPTLLVIDDAATAVPVDLLTGVVPYRDTIQSVVLAGDPIPVGGRAPNKGRNEFYNYMNDTAMRKWYRNPRQYNNFQIIQLAEQHRMRPELFNHINEVFYKDSPTKISSVNDYLKNTFGAASSDGDRFAIDLSGKKNASKYWRASKSLCNHAEAEAIVDMVAGLLKHPPPPNGTQIQPRDILISTPYAGQEAVIRVLLMRKRIIGSGNNMIRIASPNNARGQESTIQIISLCINDPDPLNNTEQISNRENLNIMFTRAKDMQIVFGNFRPWIQAIKNNVEGWGVNAEGAKRLELVKIVGSFWPTDDPKTCTIISEADFHSGFYDNKPPTRKSFPDLITINKTDNGENKE
ncbi:hypothetical protein KCU92_g6938, partial [Aureobasidium melanogenum]|jgi:hypothetical protein